jgi:16S rRNA pseudouridine516 synthase
VAGDESIVVDGEAVIQQSHLYLKMHKPEGVVCATSDAENPTLIDVLFEQAELLNDTAVILALEKSQLQIVGRLDKDTTGLVLLTTDGEWNHKVASPKSQCDKTYSIGLAEPIAEKDIQQLSEGIVLKGEIKPTLPATVSVRSETEIDLTIQEGKYHQVKRMLAAIGNKVIALHRISIGQIRLTEDLEPSQFRHLTTNEINQFNHD